MRAIGTASDMNGWSLGALVALLIAAPFETREPLLSLPGQSISSVEMVLIAVMAGWGTAGLATRRWPRWRTALTAPWLALLAGLTISAVMSPVNPGNAVHMVARLAMALAIALFAFNVVTSERRLVAVLAAALTLGVLVALLVMVDTTGVPTVIAWLSHFRDSLQFVGGQVRASGPLQYPTVASMTLEILFALGLGYLLVTVDLGSRRSALVVAVLLVVVGQAVMLTFTRAGVLSLLASLAVAGFLRWRAQGFDLGARLVLVLGVLVPVQALITTPGELFWLRATSEGQAGWYDVEIDAPRSVSLATGALSTVPVTVTNTGRATLDSSLTPPFRLSYHWLLEDEDRVLVRGGARTLFPAPVSPGDSVTLNARVYPPPEPGTYRILWDVEYEHRLWFSAEDDPSEFMITLATVSGSAVGRLSPAQDLPPPPSRFRPGRPRLWRAAVELFADHPVLGIGPDNYRLSYGPYLNLTRFDTRTHSNNLYLEMLVGGGLLGAALFAWLLWRVGVTTLRGVNLASGAVMPGAVGGVAAAVGAIGVHGVFDAFLAATPTYVLIAITVGLVLACEGLSHVDANRV